MAMSINPGPPAILMNMGTTKANAGDPVRMI